MSKFDTMAVEAEAALTLLREVDPDAFKYLGHLEMSEADWDAFLRNLGRHHPVPASIARYCKHLEFRPLAAGIMGRMHPEPAKFADIFRTEL